VTPIAGFANEDNEIAEARALQRRHEEDVRAMMERTEMEKELERQAMEMEREMKRRELEAEQVELEVRLAREAEARHIQYDAEMRERIAKAEAEAEARARRVKQDVEMRERIVRAEAKRTQHDAEIRERIAHAEAEARTRAEAEAEAIRMQQEVEMRERIARAEAKDQARALVSEEQVKAKQEMATKQKMEEQEAQEARRIADERNAQWIEELKLLEKEQEKKEKSTAERVVHEQDLEQQAKNDKALERMQHQKIFDELRFKEKGSPYFTMKVFFITIRVSHLIRAANTVHFIMKQMNIAKKLDEICDAMIETQFMWPKLCTSAIGQIHVPRWFFEIIEDQCKKHKIESTTIGHKLKQKMYCNITELLMNKTTVHSIADDFFERRHRIQTMTSLGCEMIFNLHEKCKDLFRKLDCPFEDNFLDQFVFHLFDISNNDFARNFGNITSSQMEHPVLYRFTNLCSSLELSLHRPSLMREANHFMYSLIISP
jgi:hypothetical protein